MDGAIIYGSTRKAISSSEAELVKERILCSLSALEISSCVVEILFEIASNYLKLPSPFDDIVFGPLQILTTVICTNLTMLILKKADLFDVEFGFKMSKIRTLFENSRKELDEIYEISQNYADDEITKIIEEAKIQSREIYENLKQFDPHKDSARGELEKINQMFSMNIDFEKEWLQFIGIPV